MPGYIPAKCPRLFFTLSFYISPVLDMDLDVAHGVSSSFPFLCSGVASFFFLFPDLFVSSIIPAIALMFSYIFLMFSSRGESPDIIGPTACSHLG